MKKKSIITSEQALKRLMRICSGKELCEYDLVVKMDRWGISETEQAKILMYLEKERFYSNKRYANAFINDKLKFQKWGRIKIKHALRAKGIPEEVIDDLLCDNKDHDYRRNLEELMKGRMKTVKPSESIQQLKGRLYRSALSRGYEPEMIFQELNKLVKG